MKTGLTLEEAKDQVAKRETGKSFDEMMVFSRDRFHDQAAELHRSSAVEAYEKQIAELRDLLSQSEGVRDKTALILKTQTIRELRRQLSEKDKEIEKLRKSNDQLICHIHDADERIKELLEEIDRLKS